MFKIHLLITSFIFIAQFGFSQFIFKPEYISVAPYPFEEGNVVVLQALNPLPGMHFYHQNTEYEVGDTISDYAMYDTLFCVFFQDTLISIMSPYQDFEMESFQTASNLNTYDGSLTLEFNNRQIFAGEHFDIVYTSNGAYGPTPQSSDSTSFHFTDVVPAIFKLYGEANEIGIQDDLAYRPFRICGIMFDQSMNFLAFQGLNFEVTLSDVTTGCDGTAHATPVNAVGTVVYEWNDDANLTNDSVSDLCPGVYYVYAKDLANQYSAFKQFVITDITNNYYDPDNTGSATDTVHLNYLNCFVDYTSAIDSIQLSIMFSHESNDTIYNNLNLLIFQNSDTVIINDLVITPSFDQVLFDIAIYCNSLKSTEFYGKKILSIKGDQSASIHETNSELISIYPNPVDHYLNFSDGLSSGVVVDLNGRQVLSFNNQDKIDVSNLQSGIYLVHLNDQSKAAKFSKR